MYEIKVIKVSKENLELAIGNDQSLWRVATEAQIKEYCDHCDKHGAGVLSYMREWSNTIKRAVKQKHLFILYFLIKVFRQFILL